MSRTSRGFAIVCTFVVGLPASVAAQTLGQWTSGTPMPSARSEVAVAAIADKVYVVGGFGGGRELEIYEPVNDRWYRGAPVPRAIHHTSAVAAAGKLYVIGGYANGWEPVSSVYVYDPGTDRWRTVDGRVYVIAGGTRPGGSASAHNEIFSRSP